MACNIFQECFNYSIVVRRTAHNLMVVGSMPDPIERLVLLGKVLTQIVPLSTQEYKWVPGR